MSQKGAVEALSNPDFDVQEMAAEYRRRRNFVYQRFTEMGLPCSVPRGAFYAFPRISGFGLTSRDFAFRLLEEERVAVVPGSAFGACGEGHVRAAYATSMDNLKEALDRIERFIGRLRAARA
jgi:aminotransferase